MAIPKAIKDEIAKKRKWLDDNELDYRSAVAITGDNENLKGLLRSLKAQAEPIFRYDPDIQPAHAAVFVVASMRERFSGIFADLDFVEQYEDNKQDYLDTVKAYATDEERDETETTS